MRVAPSPSPRTARTRRVAAVSQYKRRTWCITPSQYEFACQDAHRAIAVSQYNIAYQDARTKYA
eukprot:1100595-Rhodomonas_salina.3